MKSRKIEKIVTCLFISLLMCSFLNFGTYTMYQSDSMNMKIDQTCGNTNTILPDNLHRDDALVGLWHFEEGSGITAQDSSGNDNHGTLDLGLEGTTNSADSWVGGIQGTGLHFDGRDDILNCGNDDSLDITEEITIIAWVKCDLENLRPTLVGKYSDLDPGYLLRWERDEGFLFAIESSPVASRKANINTVAERWYHVACTFKDDLHLYINGVLADGTAAGVIPASIGTSVADLTIGHRMDEALGFNGTIDEVELYNRALSAQEIRDNYANIALRGGWAFDDDTGSTLSDSSTFSNHGTLLDGISENNDGDTPPTWTTGIENGALLFDGVDDYVDIPAHSAYTIESNDEITLSAWVLTTANNGVIIGNQDSSGYYSLGLENGFLTAKMLSNTGTLSHLTTGQKINDNMWHYVAVILSREGGTTIQLYIDGEIQLSDSPSNFGGITSSNNINIGRNSHTEGSYFQGEIDQIFIWNTGYTSNQLSNIYDTMVASSFLPPSLVKEIPDPLTFEEDTKSGVLVNFTQYFDDIVDEPMELEYSVIRTMGEHITPVKVNYTLSFETDLANWTGAESFKIEAMNTKGLNISYNVFTVEVEPKNDIPVWTQNPPDIYVEEDINKTSDFSLDRKSVV